MENFVKNATNGFVADNVIDRLPVIDKKRGIAAGIGGAAGAAVGSFLGEEVGAVVGGIVGLVVGIAINEKGGK